MYESTLENVKSSFQPLIELAELNRKTLEKMTSVQTSYLTDCISTSIKQVKSLAESGSPQRATELSFEMIKDFETKLTGATEQNLAALAELRDAYSLLVNGSCTGSYSRIVELYNLKDKFAVAPTAANATPAAKVAAPAKKAAVKKTPAKAAVKKTVAKKAEAKPAVDAKPAVAANKVDEKPKTTVKVAAKAAPKADAAPAKKAPVKRAAAKPAVKKAAAKPAVKKAAAKPAPEAKKTATKPAAKAAPSSSAARPVAKAKPASVSSVRPPAAKTH